MYLGACINLHLDDSPLYVPVCTIFVRVYQELLLSELVFFVSSKMYLDGISARYSGHAQWTLPLPISPDAETFINAVLIVGMQKMVCAAHLYHIRIHTQCFSIVFSDVPEKSRYVSCKTKQGCLCLSCSLSHPPPPGSLQLYCAGVCVCVCVCVCVVCVLCVLCVSALVDETIFNESIFVDS
jgi:hypothetical protein